MARIAKNKYIKIDTWGIDAMPDLALNQNNNIYKTFITQEMLKKNFSVK